MSKSIASEQFTAQLFEILEETFEQVHGIYLDKGTSLFETLATITAVQASRPVSGNCATLAAQVAHVTFYLDVLERYLRTRESVRADWGEIWRRVKEVSPEEWDDLQTQLRQSYHKVQNLFRQIETWDGDAISGAMAIVVHTAYHLGEIRQALCVVQ